MHRGATPHPGYVEVVAVTAGIELTKHHGLGNDFLVARLPQRVDVPIDPGFAVEVCDRRRGIGADGLLFALPGTDGADVDMVLLNSDGSTAEVSGNGLRCLAQAVLRSRGLRNGRLVIRTAAGARIVTSEPTTSPVVDLLSAEMGAVRAGPAVVGLPLDGIDVIDVIGLDIGNPHVVIHVATLDGVDPAQAGPRIEAAVPGGVNVHLLVVDGADTIRLVHWERGAGVTQACGSGASVAAMAAHRWGLCGEDVLVRMPGGDATVTLHGDEARLKGTATLVGEVTLA